ncbi:MAG: aminopeptidase [Polyangiaceae bacterium]|nr:aminopeptidase [Polyangiaceae bacterium]
MLRLRVAIGVLFVVAAAAAGCTPLRYVTQAAAGQEQLNGRGIAIDEVVEHDYLDRRTRELLVHVARIKAFGERHGLRHTKNYERYLWLGRPAVVWVVSACDPLAFRPKTWHFPVVGSLTYTGWFDHEEARAYAGDLARAGLDIDVRPSPAYSTLGWFDDPVLSTMLVPGDEALGELAEVILHETLHATFYVPGQSTLNESVASFFGETLAVRYLDEAIGPNSNEKEAFVALLARSEERGRAMRDAYFELERLYASPRSQEEKLAGKSRITSMLRTTLHLTISNATLIQYKTYGSGQEELAALFHACGESYPKMLSALDRVRAIAKSAPPHADPAKLLEPILPRGCN